MPKKSKHFTASLKTKELTYSMFKPGQVIDVKGTPIRLAYCENREEPEVQKRLWFVQTGRGEYKILKETYLTKLKQEELPQFLTYCLKGPPLP